MKSTKLATRNEKVLGLKARAGVEHPRGSAKTAGGAPTHPEKILGFCREMVTKADWADYRAWELGGVALNGR